MTKRIICFIIVSNDTLYKEDILIEFVKNFFIFSGLSDEELDYALKEINPDCQDFKRGECIFSRRSSDKKIGFIINGRAEVRETKSDGSFSVLNQLKAPDSFGLLSIFSCEEFPTEIWALTNSEVVFLSENDVKMLMSKNQKISINLIKFMAERISFLNSKIKTFTGTRVEDRLFSYLLGKWKNNGSKDFTLNFKKCSEAINAGRASVYRAVSALEEEGTITLNNKTISLLKTERNKK